MSAQISRDWTLRPCSISTTQVAIGNVHCAPLDLAPAAVDRFQKKQTLSEISVRVGDNFKPNGIMTFEGTDVPHIIHYEANQIIQKQLESCLLDDYNDSVIASII